LTNISYFYKKIGRQEIETKSFQHAGWMNLDNAAKLFPAITSGELTSVFRITATLKDPVRYSALKEAVEVTSKRFPYFSASLGNGLFWNYLELNDSLPRIMVDEEAPCTAFPLRRKNEPLYRILVKSNRISVEFIHILTDGHGAFNYLKSLLYTYLSLSGKSPGPPEGIILPETPFSDEETEDGYNRFFRKLPPPEKLTNAWHLPFRLNSRPRLRIIRAEVSVKEMLELTRNNKASVTEYLVAVYLFSLQKIYLSGKESGKREKRHIIRTEVPVNMRNKLPSATMRNFSLFVTPEVDLRLGTYSFDEVLKIVKNHIQASSDIKQIGRFLSSNVSHERSLVIRVLPLFIKRMAIAAFYRGLGSKKCSGIITNMGPVPLPLQMKEHIESLDIIPPPPNNRVKVSCGIISVNDRMRICFSNISVSNELERNILKYLSDAGLHVRLLNN
jgi:NRPS condensation-like uncharacterized protein